MGNLYPALADGNCHPSGFVKADTLVACPHCRGNIVMYTTGDFPGEWKRYYCIECCEGFYIWQAKLPMKRKRRNVRR
jgi:hypothetical protein